MFHPPPPHICSNHHYFEVSNQKIVSMSPKTDDLVLSFQQGEVKECDAINAMPNSLVDC